MTKTKKARPPAPGTYPAPEGYYWSTEPGVSGAVAATLGILGLFSFGLTWIVLIVLYIATPSQQVVARRIPVVYAYTQPQPTTTPVTPPAALEQAPVIWPVRDGFRSV